MIKELIYKAAQRYVFKTQVAPKLIILSTKFNNEGLNELTVTTIRDVNKISTVRQALLTYIKSIRYNFQLPVETKLLIYSELDKILEEVYGDRED